MLLYDALKSEAFIGEDLRTLTGDPETKIYFITQILEAGGSIPPRIQNLYEIYKSQI